MRTREQARSARPRPQPHRRAEVRLEPETSPFDLLSAVRPRARLAPCPARNNPMSLDALKPEVCSAIDALRDELVAASHAIHANPELAFEEKFAADLLTKTVEKHGLKAERGAYKVETAYAAEFGQAGAPVMSLL